MAIYENVTLVTVRINKGIRRPAIVEFEDGEVELSVWNELEGKFVLSIALKLVDAEEVGIMSQEKRMDC